LGAKSAAKNEDNASIPNPARSEPNFMANTSTGDKKPKKKSSAVKQARTSLRRRLANQMVHSRLNTAERQLRESIKAGEKTKIVEQLRLVFSLADRAAKSHVISRNAAARKKSRLSKLLGNGKKK
jgi:small subunit ribosomal protein S20